MRLTAEQYSLLRVALMSLATGTDWRWGMAEVTVCEALLGAELAQ